MDATSCTAPGTYPGVFDGFIKCANCPDTCTKCGYSNPKLPTGDTFSCTECKAGFILTSGKCKPKC